MKQPFQNSLDGTKVEPNKLRLVGHIFFFGSILFINNPFFEMVASIKYTIFVVMVIVGLAITPRYHNRKLGNFIFLILAFVCFYLIAILRTNFVVLDKASDSELLPIFQAGLSLFTVVASILFYKSVDTKSTINALFWTSVPCGFWIALNFTNLNDRDLMDWFALGNLSLDSYQTAATILVMAALSSLGKINLNRKLSYGAGALLISYLFFGYFIFQGLARGEAIAFVSASLMFFAPRLSLFLLPFAYSIFSFLVLNFDTPLTARLREVLDGDYGSRDRLIAQSIDLLWAEPQIMVLGGGMNYFQKYWTLPFGLYPHNQYVEAIITGGLGFCLVLLFSYVYPILSNLKKLYTGQLSSSDKVLFSILLFLDISAAKSGTLVISWGIGIFLCVGLKLIRSEPIKQNKILKYRTKQEILEN